MNSLSQIKENARTFFRTAVQISKMAWRQDKNLLIPMMSLVTAEIVMSVVDSQKTESSREWIGGLTAAALTSAFTAFVIFKIWEARNLNKMDGPK
jgi:hypothetical protein